MDLEIGCVVRSKAGRDQDQFLVVVGMEAGYVLLCDGKERPLEKPKRKNRRHIQMTRERLPIHLIKTNREVKKALRAFAQTSVLIP